MKSHLEASPLVGTHLWTRPSNLALVNVITRPIVTAQLIALSALTIKTRLSVNAHMLATAVIQFAFVTSTFIDRFILGIGAVLCLIAHFRQWNAHATAAIKFGLAVTCSLGNGYMGEKAKIQFENHWHVWSNRQLCLRQFNSSLPSLHSALPEQWKRPWMHVLSAHWNWSARQVTFWHSGASSSSLSGQSFSPSPGKKRVKVGIN